MATTTKAASAHSESAPARTVTSWGRKLTLSATSRAWAAAWHMVLACSAPRGAQALALPEFTTTAVAQPSSRCSMVV